MFSHLYVCAYAIVNFQNSCSGTYTGTHGTQSEFAFGISSYVFGIFCFLEILTNTLSIGMAHLVLAIDSGVSSIYFQDELNWMHCHRYALLACVVWSCPCQSNPAWMNIDGTQMNDLPHIWVYATQAACARKISIDIFHTEFSACCVRIPCVTGALANEFELGTKW